MSRTVDEIIREAMQRGEFENLSNKGKKLDLDEYFNAPEDLRLAYGLLKDNNFLPEEVQLLKEIEELKGKLAKTQVEPERKTILKEIEARRLKYNLLVERFHRQR